MRKQIAKLVIYLAAFGMTVLGASRIEAANYTYSTTLDLSKGSFILFYNKGVPTSQFNENLPQPGSRFTLNPGDSVSGAILFTNNESMVMTNSTGTTSDSDYVCIVFIQSSPSNNASCHFSIKLLGVSGQLNSPNPSTGMSGSVYPASLFQQAVMPQVTTSNVSFRGFTYSITNGFYLPLVLQPDNISLQAGGGDISVGTSTVPIFAPIPLNIQLNGNAVILSWNDPLSTFSLQTSTNITGSFTNVSGATSPYTNTITGPHKFFRLRSN